MKTAYSLIGLVLLGYTGVACAQQTFYPSAGRSTLVSDSAYEKSIWSVEVAGNANFAMKDIMDGDWGKSPRVHTYGADITLVRSYSQHVSFNLRFAYSYGSDSYDEPTNAGAVEGVPPVDVTVTETARSDSFDVNNFSLMPGVRFTIPLEEDDGTHDHLYPAFYAGLNAGVMARSIKCEGVSADVATSSHDSSIGLAYSAEVGLRLPLSDQFEVFAAYQIGGSTARPSIRFSDASDSVSSHHQYYNTARIGFSYTF